MQYETGPYCPFGTDDEDLATDVRAAQFLDPVFGRLSYWIIGDFAKSLPATVFLHGIGGDKSSWLPVMLAAESAGVDLGPCLFLDLPGFGHSQNRQMTLDANEVGSAIIRMADGLGIDRLHLVGQSVGGYLALSMAQTWGSRILSVTTFSGTLIREFDKSGTLSQLASRNAMVRHALYRVISLLGIAIRLLLTLLVALGAFAPLLRTAAAHPRRLKRSVMLSIAHGVRPEAYF